MCIKETLVSYDKYIYEDGGKSFINGTEQTNNNAVYETRAYYKEYLSSHFENLVMLTGAGSSIGIGKTTKGKTRIELWQAVKQSITEPVLKRFCSSIKHTYPTNDDASDIELMLSQAYKSIDYVAQEKIENKSIESIIQMIEKQIVKECKLDLPDAHSPHQLLLSKATIRKLKYPRLKLFTLNYDTLFEQAANREKYTIIDGFSFTIPRTFNGLYYDYDLVIREKSRIKNEENYVPRVFHIYKPHGSLDWHKDNGIIMKKEKTDKPLIIYPKDSKYESSYEQPFFEMMARFQQTLRLQNVQLICIGFSFYDKHISTMIKEAIESNPSIRLMIVSTDITNNTYYDWYKERAKRTKNIILIAESFVDFADNYPYPISYDDKELLEAELREE